MDEEFFRLFFVKFKFNNMKDKAVLKEFFVYFVFGLFFFLELVYLNFVYNRIVEEEVFLVVVVWSMLVELVIYNNFLILDYSGDFLLLKRFFIVRFGIKFVRKVE